MRRVLVILAAVVVVAGAFTAGALIFRSGDERTVPTKPPPPSSNTVNITTNGPVNLQVACFRNPPEVPITTNLTFDGPGRQQVTDIAPGFCNITAEGEAPPQVTPRRCDFTNQPSLCEVTVRTTE